MEKLPEIQNSDLNVLNDTIEILMREIHKLNIEILNTEIRCRQR